MTDTKMTFDEFLGLAEAYGGEIGRWPEERRVAAARLAADDADAATALAEARELDLALDLDAAPAPSADLMARVLGDAAMESAARTAASAGLAANRAVRPRAATGVSALLGRLGFGSGALVAAGLGAAAMAGLAVGVIAPVGGIQTQASSAASMALDEYELEEMELLELAVVDALFDGDDDASL